MEQSIWQEIGQLYHFMASQLKKSLSLRLKSSMLHRRKVLAFYSKNIQGAAFVFRQTPPKTPPKGFPQTQFQTTIDQNKTHPP